MKSYQSVLVITERFYPEDFGINDLVRAWQEQGYDVGVLTQTPSYPFGKAFEGYKNALFQKQEWEGIKVFRIFSVMGYKKHVFFKLLNYCVFVFLASWAAIFIGRKYDKVFVYHAGPLTQALPALFLKKIFKKPFSIWTLDVWPDSVYAYGFKQGRLLRKMLDFLVQSIYRNCEKVFVSSQGFAQRIKEYAPQAKVVFAPQWVPRAVNFDGVSAIDHFGKGFHFTFAGNIGKVQNLENVVRGFALAYQKNSELRLNIIGDGSNLDHLKTVVEDENIKGVSFWGRQPLHEMPQWLAASDALIIALDDKPIFSLTVPAKFQVYLAAGKPIYCIVKGETARLVRENAIGLIADPADVQNIAQGFNTFLALSEQELAEFQTNMQRLLKEEFDSLHIIHHITEELGFQESFACKQKELKEVGC